MTESKGLGRRRRIFGCATTGSILERRISPDLALSWNNAASASHEVGFGRVSRAGTNAYAKAYVYIHSTICKDLRLLSRWNHNQNKA